MADEATDQGHAVEDGSALRVETPTTVATRVERTLPCGKSENVTLAPGCSMKYLPPKAAYDEMRAMVGAAQVSRRKSDRAWRPARLKPRPRVRPA